MGFRRHLPVAVCVLFLAIGIEVTAYGQSPGDRVTARGLVDEAEKKLGVGDASGALELFGRADALVPAPTLKLAIARTKAKLGQLLEAQTLMIDVSRSSAVPNEPKQWASARSAAAAEAAELADRIPKVTVIIRGASGEESRSMTIDGVAVPAAAIGVARAIDPGKHTIRVESDGFLPAQTQVSLSEGEKQQVELTLLEDPLGPFALPLTTSGQVRAAVAQASTKRKANDTAGALQLLQKAFDTTNAPTLGLAVAELQAKLDLLNEALSTLQRVRSLPRVQGESPKWQAARDTAKAEAEAVQKRIPKVTIGVQGLPANAVITLYMDDKIASAPDPDGHYWVNPGRHIVRAESGGSKATPRELTLTEGTKTSIYIVFGTSQSPASASRDEGASKGRVGTLSIVGFASAGVFGGIGTVLGLMAKSKADDIKQSCVGNACPADKKSDADAANGLADFSTISFGLAGAGLALGIVGLVTSGSSSKTEAPNASTNLKVNIAVGPRTLNVTGRF